MPGQKSFIENRRPGFYTDKYGTYMDKSCIRGHHVSKDFCTPVNNEVASYAVVVKMGSFGVGHTGARLYI